MLTTVTPEDVDKALRIARPEYRAMHDMNAGHSLVAGCKPGAVFLANGEYHIYVGVNGRNTKMPLIAYRVSDWSCRKMGAAFFPSVRKASEI